MKELYSKIKIIPVSQCLSHEGIVDRWVDQIAFNILNDGVMKNPIIVTYHDPYYIVVDGMHRYAAIKQLEIKDILVYEVDYFSEEVALEGWDALVFPETNITSILQELFQKDFYFEKVKNLKKVVEEIRQRKSILAWIDKKQNCTLVKKEGQKNYTVETLSQAANLLDRYLHEKTLKTLYIDNSLTLKEWPGANAHSLILRPQFTKNEIIERTLQKKLFPPKSTRHLIVERPLRVDLDISLLRASIDIAEKNQVLQDHLKWCYENNRVRYYPEPVHIFAD